METWRGQSCLRLQRSRGKSSLMVGGSPQRVRPLPGRIAFVTKRNDGDRFQIAAVFPSLPKLGSLLLHRAMKRFMGVHHVLTRLLNAVELLLLIRI